jgi:hypothetical protein
MPVALWLIVIYTTIPFVRALRELFVARWDPQLIGWTVVALIVTAAAAAIVILSRHRDSLQSGAALWIAAASVIMVIWTLRLRESPEEAVHFLEYGALAVLVHRALRPTMRDPLVFLAGALFGSLAGTVDEIIQWLSPTRFWGWRDLVLNGGAGAVVQLTLWRVLPVPERRPSPQSLRIVLRLATGQLILLLLCVVNTPTIVARYAPHLPFGAHLMTSRNPMVEFGHLHRLPGVGSFKSRLELSELAAQDRSRCAEAAALADETRHSYRHFLDTWPVAEDPFIYEFRVHLFARDRNLGKARKRGFEGSLAQQQVDTSWNENRLLQEVFGHSLDQSSYPWSPRLRKRVDSLRDPDAEFRSDVGAHLVTFASGQTIRGLLLVSVAVLLLADLAIGRFLRRNR